MKRLGRFYPYGGNPPPQPARKVRLNARTKISASMQVIGFLL
jgi:hypothetical protein